MSDFDDDPHDTNDAVEVPYSSLSEAALQGVIEEYISRDGTDYGEYEINMGDQIQRAMAQLKSKQVVILFYPKTEHCQIIDRETRNQMMDTPLAHD